MKTFAEHGLDVNRVLQALVVAGNVLAAVQGARKQRRRVPEKQERLLQLVAEHGSVTLDVLKQAFTQEWSRIAKRRERQATLLAKRDFFRNIADIVGRINAALLAGYRNPDTGKVVLAHTGARYFGLVFDYQEFTVTWHTTDDLTELTKLVPQLRGDRHVPLVAQAAAGIPAPKPVQTAAAAPPIDSSEAVAATDTLPAELVVKEDPVTGTWTLELRGHHVEIARKHGFVKIDGRIHQLGLVKDLKHVEELAGAPLRSLTRLLTKTRWLSG